MAGANAEDASSTPRKENNRLTWFGKVSQDVGMRKITLSVTISPLVRDRAAAQAESEDRTLSNWVERTLLAALEGREVILATTLPEGSEIAPPAPRAATRGAF